MSTLKGEKDIAIKSMQASAILGYVMKDSVAGMFDANGNELVKTTTVADAVNEVTIANAATGNAPSVQATGGDTNVGLDISSKGTGSVTIWTGAKGREALILPNVASAVNEVTISSAVTTEGPSIAATGGDTNVDITLKGKGTGSVIVGQATATGVKLAADQPILDSAGNELVKFVKTTTAVNELTITNNSTGLGPTLTATGETNVPITLAGKGTGAVILGQATSTDVRMAADQPIGDSSGNELIKFTKVASAVNELTISNNSTGLGPTIIASGETNVPMTISAKGTGALTLGQATGSIPCVARVTTTDGVSSGTARVVGGRAYVKTTLTDAVTAATSNGNHTDFASTYSIPANTLGLGSVTKIRGLVRVTDASGTDTLEIKVYIGATTLLTTTAFDPDAANDLVRFEFMLTSLAAAGATAAHVGEGVWVTSDGGSLVHGVASLASTNLATNGALVIKASAKWSSNTASTSANLDSLYVEII